MTDTVECNVRLKTGAELVDQITHPVSQPIEFTIDGDQVGYRDPWMVYHADYVGEPAVIFRSQRHGYTDGRQVEGVVHDYILVRAREFTGYFHIGQGVITLSRDEVDAMTMREFMALFQGLYMIT